MRSLTQQPFRTAVLVLVWGWLLFLVLTPNLLVVGASVMTRDPGSFISLPLTVDAYRQLLNPLYLEVFLHSLYMAAMTAHRGDNRIKQKAAAMKERGKPSKVAMGASMSRMLRIAHGLLSRETDYIDKYA